MKTRSHRGNVPKSRDALLDAGAATRLLGVSRNTLYAYVSRGLVRATANPENPKASLYVAADIHALVDRKTRLRRPRTAAATALDFGLPVLKTRLTHFEDGRLFYRSMDAIELSRTASLEDAARLIWNTHGFDPFAGLSFDTASITGWDALASQFADAPATDRAAALLPLLTLNANPYAGQAGQTAFRAAARLLLAVTAACTGIQGKIAPPVHKAVTRGLGKPREADHIRRALVLLADHELNASTVAVRVVASTGARLTNCVLGGLAALSGPRHGAASERARSFVAQPTCAAQAFRLVGERLEAGEHVPGFGHTLYGEGDPRARELLAHISPDPIATAVEQAVRDLSGIEPNIDFALVALERARGLPSGTALMLFAIARTVGWLAHAFEQRAAGNIIRPRAEYVNE
ncbi:MAG: citrate/2-methylcitrate synthase [Alphaproteobacteria bacterium]